MEWGIGHLVAQYRACAAAGVEPFTEEVAASLVEVSARLGDEANGAEQLVIDDPVIVLDELCRALADIAGFFAECGRHEDELMARRLALGLHAGADPARHARYLSALAHPLAALGRTEEALDARREAFGTLCELAEQDSACWPEALAEAEAYGELLARDGDPATAVEVCRQAVDGLVPSAGPEEGRAERSLAQALLRMTRRSADAGFPAEALVLAQEAVVLLRRQGGPAEVADAVRAVGLRYEELNRWDEACAHLAEAADLFAGVAGAGGEPGIRLRYLQSLTDLSRAQVRLDGDTAVQTAQQCVALHRDLVREDEEHLPRLAAALVELHHRLTAAGLHVKAVYAAQEAAALYGRLHDQNPEWSTELARTHLHLGRRLSHIGRLEPAVEANGTAVELLRDDPGDRFELGLALKEFGTRLHELERFEESLAATAEAAGTFRAADELPALAATLYNLAITHNVAGHPAETVRSATEAVQIYQRLYDDDSDWAPGLYQSLGLLGAAFEHMDRFDQAITALERAVSLLERLCTPDSDGYAPDLARILHDLSRCHEQQDRLERALDHMRRSVSLYGELTQRDPDRFRGRLAGAWLSLGIYLGRLGQAEEARAATSLAADLYRQTTDRESLALALSQLASREHVLDRDEESVAARTEAIELYEECALEQPEYHGPNLARALEDLAAHHTRREEYAAALPLLERAADLWERLGDRGYLIGNLRRRLLVHCCLGQDAEDTLERLVDAQQDTEQTVRTLDAVVQELIRLDRQSPAEPLLARAFGLWEIHLLEHPAADPMVRLMLLDSRAALLARDERHSEAVTVQDETVRLLESFARDNPAGHLGFLTAARSRLAGHLYAAGRPADALDHQRQVVSGYERLAAGDPGEYRPALASALYELGRLLRDLGMADADAVLARAATLRLTLEGAGE
ncbi:tetratricopeptide repeat protein [Streptomyces sp. NPDC005706]|uniref:tetratricopeptide repeat protein n=1 Tax=Streptomyces sp. NPDC005706 TaxID=3157169 RepID=UPI0033FA3065